MLLPVSDSAIAGMHVLVEEANSRVCLHSQMLISAITQLKLAITTMETDTTDNLGMGVR